MEQKTNTYHHHHHNHHNHITTYNIHHIWKTGGESRSDRNRGRWRDRNRKPMKTHWENEELCKTVALVKN